MEDQQLTGTGISRLLDMRKASLAAHNGRPHSMELVARIDDVSYVNDSRSTFLDSTLASLAQVEGRVVWISGPLSGDLGAGYVQQLLEERVSTVVVFGSFGSNGSDMLKPFKGQVYFAEELRTAVFLARELAKPGEAVLFSPACPSGNGFANYEERGVEFKRAVKDL
jgi:UDP-N-acetylmuramoylalanine--D-glutamate ligase